MKFADFGFDPRLMEGIDAMNYVTPTPVQQQAVPSILAGRDVIVSAQTGTGKTAAYLLPIIHKIITQPADDHINALVVVPTRELAIQIAQNLEGFSYFTPISSIAVYGGSDGATYSTERQALSGGADIVICTPGRMISHLNMGYVKVDQLQYLILDEADRMLDMGFYDDLVRIISFLPKKRQNLLLSATMPPRIRELAKKILHQPEEITISVSKPPAKIVQQAYVVFDKQKIALVKFLLKENDFPSILIFCSKKTHVKELTRELKHSGFKAEEIHSDLAQNEREQVLANFRSRQLRILVATDILSRGIDIDNINLVINYDVPHDGEDYVHRIGRTARAETDGIAFTFVGETEQRKFAAIERLLGEAVPKASLPQQLGESPTYNPGGRGKTRTQQRRYRGRRPPKQEQGGPSH